MYFFIKRTFDIVFSSISLIFLFPLMLFLYFIVFLSIGKPVIIKQKRVGKFNRIFTLYKFKTMKDSMGKDGKMLTDSERLTKLGSILRSTSLDELPQLINVFFGDMSFIGPRPKTIEEICYITESDYVIRHYLRPGLTGLAAVNGRNKLTPLETYNYDLYYVLSVNPMLDIQILCRTLVVVLGRKNVNFNDKISFIPHKDFWQKLCNYSQEQIQSFMRKADSIKMGNLKQMEPSSKLVFDELFNKLKHESKFNKVK